MESTTIIRAWKDKAYRNTLSDAELALLPAHPAGLTELTDSDLAVVVGGKKKKNKKRRKNTSRSRSRSRSRS